MKSLLTKCVETVRENSEASIICIQSNNHVDFEFHGTDAQLEDIIYTLAVFWKSREDDKIIEDIINELLGEEESDDDDK